MPSELPTRAGSSKRPAKTSGRHEARISSRTQPNSRHAHLRPTPLLQSCPGLTRSCASCIKAYGKDHLSGTASRTRTRLNMHVTWSCGPLSLRRWRRLPPGPAGPPARSRWKARAPARRCARPKPAGNETGSASVKHHASHTTYYTMKSTATMKSLHSLRLAQASRRVPKHVPQLLRRLGAPVFPELLAGGSARRGGATGPRDSRRRPGQRQRPMKTFVMQTVATGAVAAGGGVVRSESGLDVKDHWR